LFHPAMNFSDSSFFGNWEAIPFSFPSSMSKVLRTISTNLRLQVVSWLSPFRVDGVQLVLWTAQFSRWQVLSQ
jgi:hypothetical protein